MQGAEDLDSLGQGGNWRFRACFHEARGGAAKIPQGVFGLHLEPGHTPNPYTCLPYPRKLRPIALSASLNPINPNTPSQTHFSRTLNPKPWAGHVAACEEVSCQDPGARAP